MTIEIQTRALPDLLEVDPDEHTAEGIIVPFGVPTEIVERRADGFVRYTEQFEPGSLDRAKRVPHRVHLSYTHDDTLQNRLGYMMELEDRTDGGWAKFRLDKSIAERAVDVLSTSHQALSIGFQSIIPEAFTERTGDHVYRRSVHLLHVAGVTVPAYDTARLVAVREDLDGGEPTAAELAERSRRAELEEAMTEARKLVADGARWAKFTGGVVESGD